MEYQDAVVYTITTGDDFYVGSTRDFTDRWRDHKNTMANKNSHKYNYKVYQKIRVNKNEWTMTIHHAFPCDTKQELKKEEQRTIDELKPTLNDRRAYTSEEQKKEQDKQYRLENKQRIKQWKEDNKERMKEYCKQYYLDNKERHNQQNKQYRLDNKDKIKEQATQYRLDNKDKISQWREDNKERLNKRAAEKITCICGAIVSRQHLARHKKSKKHLNYCVLISTK